MLNRNFIYLVIGVLVSIMWSCGEDGGEVEHNDSDTAHVNIQYVDSIYELSDTFTQIKKSLCGSNIDTKLLYTNENSSYIPVDLLDPTAFFIYISNVDCGEPGGTCGDYINIIKRVDDNAYKNLLQVCGQLDSVDFSIMKLYFSTLSDKKQYVVDLASSTPLAQFLSINHIPYSEIEYLAEQLDVLPENLVFAQEKTDNLDAIYVQQQVWDNNHVKIVQYKLNLNGLPYAFAIIRHTNISKETCIGGLGNLTTQVLDGQYNIKYEDGYQTYKYSLDMDKKTFVKK